MNGPVIFMAKGTKVYPRPRGNTLVAKYGLPEGSCVIPNKAAYMDDETWAKVVNLAMTRIAATRGFPLQPSGLGVQQV